MISAEPLWTLDLEQHWSLKKVDESAYDEWIAWASTYHPIVWEVCDFGEAWVLRCYAWEPGPTGARRLVVDCETHGVNSSCWCADVVPVHEDVVVPPPPGELVARTRRLLST